MTNAGIGTYGLSAKAFSQLSRLEEAVFLAIRDGKIEPDQYLDFICKFTKSEKANIIEESEKWKNEKGSAAFLIFEAEKVLGSHLQIHNEDFHSYLNRFKRFLKKGGIQIDFRKTP